MSEFQAIQEECAEANRKLPGLGLVDITFGNVSVADPERRVFAIKPSGVDYADLKAEDMVVLSYEGEVLEGDLRPSSDTPTHAHLLREFAGCASVVHTHSRKAVGFAQAGRAIPCLGTTHADYFNGPVPVTRSMMPEEVGGEYELETGKVIVETFEGLSPMEVPAVLVQHHGPFVWGPSSAKALETALALEVVAEMALHTLALNFDCVGAPGHLLEKHFSRKHGPGAYYGQK
ncbi:MAG: L-ribulose-5-phosphate 4-epimerase AraD [Verrucomicrobiota bacterium]